MPFLSEMFNNDHIENLFEAIRYEDMFRDLLNRPDMSEQMRDRYKQAVANVISHAKEKLRTTTTTPEGRVITKAAKEDRMVWFLRLSKIALVQEYANEESDSKEAQEYADKVLRDYQRKARTTNQPVYTMSYLNRVLMGQLEHYLSLPIPEIRNYVFQFQDPEDVIEDFRKFEHKWQTESKGAIEDDEAKPIIKFANGLAWYDLDKAYCSKEADAMGHCGNEPRRHTGDTILSLRSTIQRGNKTLYKPYLTFILDSHGMLGEMKGRFNNKPEEQFHDEIIALLRSPIVKGIKGGGYVPERNFSMRDLPHDVREKLTAEKPGLATLEDIYHMAGAQSPRFIEKLHSEADDAGIDVEDVVVTGKRSGMVVIKSYDDLGRFLQRADDDAAEYFYDIFDGSSDPETLVDDNFNEEDLYELIDGLRTEEYRNLMARLGMPAVPHNSPNYRRVVLQAADVFKRDEELVDYLRESIRLSHDQVEKSKEQAKAILMRFIECGWYFECYSLEIMFDQENPLTGEVKLVISLSTFVDILSARDDDDSDMRWEYETLREGRGIELSYDNMRERRKEEELPFETSSSRLKNNEYFRALAHQIIRFDEINFKNFSSGFARLASL
jgi:hypothetical protein